MEKKYQKDNRDRRKAVCRVSSNLNLSNSHHLINQAQEAASDLWLTGQIVTPGEKDLNYPKQLKVETTTIPFDP